VPTVTTPPQLDAGARIGKPPVVVISVQLPSGHSDGTAATGSHSQAGAASGSGSASPLIDPTGSACVSCTTAQSQGGSASAASNELWLLGLGLAGGRSSDNADRSGSIVALDVGPIASVAVARWMATSASSPSAASSGANADLTTARIGDQLLTVAVLDSQSEASSSQDASGSRAHGAAATDLLDASALHGQVAVILVHSNSSSDGKAHAYIASLNGHELGSSGGGSVPIVVPGVGTIVLVPAAAQGGDSSSGAASSDVAAGGARSSVLGLAATSGDGSSPVQASSRTSAGGILGRGFPTPMTGAGIGILVLLLLLGGGVAAATGTGGWRRARRWDESA